MFTIHQSTKVTKDDFHYGAFIDRADQRDQVSQTSLSITAQLWSQMPKQPWQTSWWDTLTKTNRGIQQIIAIHGGDDVFDQGFVLARTVDTIDPTVWCSATSHSSSHFTVPSSSRSAESKPLRGPCLPRKDGSEPKREQRIVTKRTPVTQPGQTQCDHFSLLSSTVREGDCDENPHK